MLNKIHIVLIVMLATLCASCMKEEPLNSECDIISVTLVSPSPEQVFFDITDQTQTILYTADNIVFNVRHNAPLNNLQPKFEITKGATIKQLTGSESDFSTSPTATYLVTSEDGKWSRNYSLSVVPAAPQVVVDTIRYDFEVFNLDKNGKYYEWHNETLDGSFGDDWATGNAGFKLSMGSAAPEQYPTVPIDGLEGKGLQLTTRDTGPFGVWANKRLASGNFFLGRFDVENALKDAMAATQFGVPFDQKPVKMIGYYKYSRGEKMQDKNGQELVGQVDSAQVYSVLYINKDAQGNSITLQGDNVLSHPNIVAIAKVPFLVPTTEWTPFEVEYIYSKEIDEERLKNMGYNFTIVFSSSARGASFEGAIGSTLCIDKVRVICTKEEE